MFCHETLEVFVDLIDIVRQTVVAVDQESGALEIIEKRSGDGKVLRSSALMDERLSGEWSPRLVSPTRWSHVTFMSRGHLGMTKDPTFTDNVLFILLEQ